MKVRTRTKHTPIQKTEDVSGVNVLVLFFATIFIVSSVIMLFLNYGGTFAYIMILFTLFIAGVISFYAKKVSFGGSARKKFFFGAFSILAFVLYFSVAFRSFGFLFFLIFSSLGIILFYLGHKLIRFLFKTEVKPDYNERELWLKYEANQNYINHHNYFRRTNLRKKYNDSIIRNEIKGHILSYTGIFTIICLFYLYALQDFKIIFTFSILFLIGMALSITRMILVHRVKTKKEELHIYSEDLGRVKYYYKDGKNLFFF